MCEVEKRRTDRCADIQKLRFEKSILLQKSQGTWLIKKKALKQP